MLQKKAKKGQYQNFFSNMEIELVRLHLTYGELVVYVEEAKDANLIEISIFKDMKYVQLVDTGAQWCPRSEYVPLVKTMQHSLDRKSVV